MSVRPLPPYLALVPAAGKRFRRPKRQPAPPPPPDNEAVERLIRHAHYVKAIGDRLHSAATADDTLVVRALADRLEVEAGYAVHLAEKLREPVR